jgi:hypothetical protein
MCGGLIKPGKIQKNPFYAVRVEQVGPNKSIYFDALEHMINRDGQMNKIQTIRLELRAPLFYREDRNLEPWKLENSGPGDSAAAERLFCFALDAVQGQSIEPDPVRFLGPLLAAGSSVTEPANPAEAGSILELSAGTYLFAQQRENLGREAFIGMAIELQKDGLWERLGLGDRLYLRYLAEDGKMVTQAFRPYRTS